MHALHRPLIGNDWRWPWGARAAAADEIKKLKSNKEAERHFERKAIDV